MEWYQGAMRDTGPARFSPALMARWRLANRRLAHQGMTLWEFDLPPGTIDWHEHLCAFFNVLLDGRVVNRYASCQLDLPRGVALVHPAGTTHASVVGPGGARLLTMEATAPWLARVGAAGPLPDRPEILGADELITRRLCREVRVQDACSHLVVEGLMLLLLARLARGPARRACSEDALLRAAELLRQEFARTLSLQEVSAHVSIPPARLSAAFRQRFGCGIGEYLRRLRVAYVRERLGTDTPLAVLALEAGFADQSHCTRVFKALTGLPPGAYRARLRGGAG